MARRVMELLGELLGELHGEGLSLILVTHDRMVARYARAR
jgi:ABC-type lipoprotein export system ATPase subunit